MHVEFLVKDPTEIYACMIQVHKMASGIEGIVGLRMTGSHCHWPVPNHHGKIPSAVADDLGSDQCIRLYLIYMDIV